VVANADKSPEVLDAVRAEPGVASVTETAAAAVGPVHRYLEGGAGLGASYATITALRERWRRYPVGRARGWLGATDLDTITMRRHDRK